MNYYEHSGVEEETDSSVLMASTGPNARNSPPPEGQNSRDAHFLSPTVHIRTVKATTLLEEESKNKLNHVFCIVVPKFPTAEGSSSSGSRTLVASSWNRMINRWKSYSLLERRLILFTFGLIAFLSFVLTVLVSGYLNLAAKVKQTSISDVQLSVSTHRPAAGGLSLELT